MAAAPEMGRADANVSATATNDLYEKYGRQIHAYCVHQLRSREEAEDAVQTTFLNAFRSLQRGTVTEFEQAWLFKIAQNVCLSRKASSGRRLRVECPSDLQLLQDVVPSRPTDDADELIGLEEALAGMPKNQRRAILLREWQGLSYREIGEELALSQSAVEMLLFRARRSLASALEHAEPKAQKRKAGRALNAGSLLTAIKSFFTGGATVKAVAVAITAGTAAIVASKPIERAIVPHHHPAPRPALVAPQGHITPLPSPTPAQPVSLVVRAPSVVGHGRSHLSAPKAMPSSRSHQRLAKHAAAARIKLDHLAGSIAAARSAGSTRPVAARVLATYASASAPSRGVSNASTAPGTPSDQPASGGDEQGGGNGQGKGHGKGKGKGNGDGANGDGSTAPSTPVAPAPPPTNAPNVGPTAGSDDQGNGNGKGSGNGNGNGKGHDKSGSGNGNGDPVPAPPAPAAPPPTPGGPPAPAPPPVAAPPAPTPTPTPSPGGSPSGNGNGNGNGNGGGHGHGKGH